MVIKNLVNKKYYIMSDNGLEFKSAETQETLQEFSIKHCFSTPYNPSGNGLVERANRTIKELLKAKVPLPRFTVD